MTDGKCKVKYIPIIVGENLPPIGYIKAIQLDGEFVDFDSDKPIPNLPMPEISHL